MASCLGIYIDSNIIKYAKTSKEKDTLKVDAFGIKVYSNLQETIDQIVSETYSFKDIISVNISGEVYRVMYLSNLLSKRDLGLAIETEFESQCIEKKINSNALEKRYIITNDLNDKDNIKAIHLSVDKMKITKILSDFAGKNISNLTPISLSIPNIATLNEKENALIVNIEDTTILTTLVGKKVYDIQNIDYGAKKILEDINIKENSYAKAYEICKNTTIYTADAKDLTDDSNNYLEEIIPVLFQIASKVKEFISLSTIKINKVYLTGTASAINNIELYFEEVLGGVHCEILKPFFLENNPKINIRDYIEVNSAIALSLQGLGYGIKSVNFNKKNFQESFKDILNSDISFGKGKKGSKGIKGQKPNLNLNFKFNFDKIKMRKWLVTDIICVLTIGGIYFGGTYYINSAIEEKNKEISKVEEDIKKQINLIEEDQKKIENKKSSYSSKIINLENMTNIINDKNAHKNAITTFLSELQNIIPRKVQIVSIENTMEKKIVIEAKSSKYEQLAYFKSLLKSNAILEPSTIVSSGTQKEGEDVKIIIEGELP